MCKYLAESCARHKRCSMVYGKETMRIACKDMGKMLDPNSGTYVSCEAAQSKRRWTFHKSHFARNFERKMPDPNLAARVSVRGCAVKTHMDISQEPFFVDTVRKMTGKKCRTHIGPPRLNTGPLTLTVRTPQCGDIVWGKKDSHTHGSSYTHRCFYTESLLRREVFTREVWHRENFYSEQLFTQRGVFKEELLHREAEKRSSFYTQRLLHKETFAHGSFYT